VSPRLDLNRATDTMLRVGPTPLFHGIPIILAFDQSMSLADARRVHNAVTGLAARLQKQSATIDELVVEISLVLGHSGLTAQVVGGTRDVVEFRIAPS
jgi:hypothetical protein